MIRRTCAMRKVAENVCLAVVKLLLEVQFGLQQILEAVKYEEFLEPGLLEAPVLA